MFFPFTPHCLPSKDHLVWVLPEWTGWRLITVSVSSLWICQEPSQLRKALLSLGKQTGKVTFHPKGTPLIFWASQMFTIQRINQESELRKSSWNWFILPNSGICTGQLIVQGCTGHCRLFNNIPGIRLLDASSLLLLLMTIRNASRHYQMFWGTRSSLVWEPLI